MEIIDKYKKHVELTKSNPEIFEEYYKEFCNLNIKKPDVDNFTEFSYAKILAKTNVQSIEAIDEELTTFNLNDLKHAQLAEGQLFHTKRCDSFSVPINCNFLKTEYKYPILIKHNAYVDDGNALTISGTSIKEVTEGILEIFNYYSKELPDFKLYTRSHGILIDGRFVQGVYIQGYFSKIVYSYIRL